MHSQSRRLRARNWLQRWLQASFVPGRSVVQDLHQGNPSSPEVGKIRLKRPHCSTHYLPNYFWHASDWHVTGNSPEMHPGISNQEEEEGRRMQRVNQPRRWDKSGRWNQRMQMACEEEKKTFDEPRTTQPEKSPPGSWQEGVNMFLFPGHCCVYVLFSFWRDVLLENRFFTGFNCSRLWTRWNLIRKRFTVVNLWRGSRAGIWRDKRW